MNRTRWGVFLFCSAFGALVCAASCGDDEPAKSDGPAKVDGGGAVPEDTAERCQDAKDNDADGHTDCADQNCWAFSFCADAGAADAGPEADSAADGPQPDSAGDGPEADSAADGPEPDGAADGPAPDSLADGPEPDSAADGPAPDSAADGPLPDSAADGAAPDSAPDSAPDAAADTGSVDTAGCGNGFCELGEACDDQHSSDGGATLSACPADCPSDTSPATSKNYCCVEGICVGAGCNKSPDCKPAP